MGGRIVDDERKREDKKAMGRQSGVVSEVSE